MISSKILQSYIQLPTTVLTDRFKEYFSTSKKNRKYLCEMTSVIKSFFLIFVKFRTAQKTGISAL